MKKLVVVGSIVLLVAIIGVAMLGVNAASAQGPTPPAYGRTLGMGMGGFGGPQNSLVAVAAKVLGMDQTALVAELNAAERSRPPSKVFLISCARPLYWLASRRSD